MQLRTSATKGINIYGIKLVSYSVTFLLIKVCPHLSISLSVLQKKCLSPMFIALAVTMFNFLIKNVNIVSWECQMTHWGYRIPECLDDKDEECYYYDAVNTVLVFLILAGCIIATLIIMKLLFMWMTRDLKNSRGSRTSGASSVQGESERMVSTTSNVTLDSVTRDQRHMSMRSILRSQMVEVRMKGCHNFMLVSWPLTGFDRIW